MNEPYSRLDMRPYDDLPVNVQMPPGVDPHPAGNWLLADYLWDEDTGVARMVYQRKWDSNELFAVEQSQPSGPHHMNWTARKAIDHDAMLTRHFETVHATLEMRRAEAY